MRRGRNEQAKAQSDKDYEETAATVSKQNPLTADEEAELARLWRKLVKLYHPERILPLTPSLSPSDGERVS